MSTGKIIADIFAVILVVIGAHLAFRQAFVLRLIAQLTGKPQRPHSDESPAHYVMIISGVMMAAFGLVILGFTIAYTLFTAP